MPGQREITLHPVNRKSLAVGTGIGNNAAWPCPCGRERPLIGSLRIAREVDCPDCSRRYRLVSTDADNPAAGRVIRIDEIGSNQLDLLRQ